MNKETTPSLKEEFDALLQELSGVSASDAKRNEEGWFFVPKEADLETKDRNTRMNPAVFVFF